MVIGRYHHPIWTMVASTVLVAVGLGLLAAGMPIMAVALALYGAGIGIVLIARGTLPYGPVRSLRLRHAYGPAGHAQPSCPSCLSRCRGIPDATRWRERDAHRAPQCGRSRRHPGGQRYSAWTRSIGIKSRIMP